MVAKPARAKECLNLVQLGAFLTNNLRGLQSKAVKYNLKSTLLLNLYDKPNAKYGSDIDNMGITKLYTSQCIALDFHFELTRPGTTLTGYM